MEKKNKRSRSSGIRKELTEKIKSYREAEEMDHSAEKGMRRLDFLPGLSPRHVTVNIPDVQHRDRILSISSEKQRSLIKVKP